MPMTPQERQVIDDLFDKLRDVEMQASSTRDPEAETHIRGRIVGQPGAPYYMAQTIVMQEQALDAAQARIQELEDELARRPTGSGGFLSSLFGGGSQPQTSRPPQREPDTMQGMMPGGAGPGSRFSAPPAGMMGAQAPGRGGGFLAGAASTAMGVAGGMMLGSLLGSAFGGSEAQAAAPPSPQAEPASSNADESDFGDDLAADFGDDT